MPATPVATANMLTHLNEVNFKNGVYKMFGEGTFTLDIFDRGKFGSPKLAKMAAEKSGKYIRVQAHTSGNPNTGVPTAAGRSYPPAGSQETNALYFREKTMVSGFGITLEAESASDSAVQSVIDRVSFEMQAIQANTRVVENRWMLGDGSAKLLQAIASTSWNDSTKKLSIDVDTSPVPMTEIQVGMEVTVRALQAGGAGTGTKPAGWAADVSNDTVTEMKRAKITAKDTAASPPTITLTYADGTAISMSTTDPDGMGVFIGDGQNKAPYGLGIACFDHNPQNHGFDPGSTLPDVDELSQGFGGVDRSTATWAQGYELSLAGADISVVDHIEPLEDVLIEREPSIFGENGIVAIMKPKYWRRIVHQLEANKQTFERKKITAGQWEVVRYGIFTFGYDHKAPDNTILFAAPEHVFRLVRKEWRLETRTGSQWKNIEGPTGRPTSSYRADLRCEKENLYASCRLMAAFTNLAD